MIFGGIPYYLKHWDGRYGLSQNIDKIVFKEDAPLKNELNNLYASLFSNSSQVIEAVRALGGKSKGNLRRGHVPQDGKCGVLLPA